MVVDWHVGIEGYSLLVAEVCGVLSELDRILYFYFFLPL